MMGVTASCHLCVRLPPVWMGISDVLMAEGVYPPAGSVMVPKIVMMEVTRLSVAKVSVRAIF